MAQTNGIKSRFAKKNLSLGIWVPSRPPLLGRLFIISLSLVLFTIDAQRVQDDIKSATRVCDCSD